MSVTQNEINTYYKEYKDLLYQWNRQQDFNEWYDDVYISSKDAGGHTTKELWDLFEKHEDSKTEMLPQLLIKWGCVNGGDFNGSPEALAIYNTLNDIKDGSLKYKQKSCEVIDLYNGEICSWWENKIVTKEEAKEYITNYKSNGLNL